MDDVALATLEAETSEDLRVVLDAGSLARRRFGAGTEPELEATAYQLARLYGCIEQMGVRVARAFENHIDQQSGWRAELIRRMSLDIPGVRPALFPKDLLAPLHDVKGFRHVVRHAYDVRLDAARISRVLENADRCVALLPSAVSTFFSRVRPPR